MQLVANYVLKMVIKFPFYMISLCLTSRYVLIDISSLTQFLCRNLFVMSCLILQHTAISANVLEIRLPSLSITPYRWLMLSQIPCNPLLQRFPRMLSKFASFTMRGHFCEDFYLFNPPLWATVWSLVACFSEFCECSQNSRSRLPYTAPLFS